MGFPVHPYLKRTLVAVTWLPVAFTVFDHVLLPCQVSGFSMAPTFNPGTESTAKDVVLIRKYNLKWPTSLERGDVVMFRSPEDPEKLVTKRVVGLQGDVIIPRDSLYPKKQALVPRNHLWVEGDNAFHLVDSNKFGPISQGLVVGKVMGIVWPLLRAGSDISGGARNGFLQGPETPESV
ncbi:LexA/Signal peptidase [Metschnikowia bicuspidata var. bicuspidata NRRL YB-4993]|uniref:Mitochondrial inner membrane protease subunit n=1 Tax=Metschnikowia bicuspidata var. bicuspidata NRRL YB-4993 TaxID=869754 RepID=A0A1A0H9V4_9ASCO|nr:LexA/Signal peptidase [Metschnikowia bicuspidata var. bicuspidata NRRL YB-4993]OBA20909.1 LexA/Signal peptidase [Metschnikowia bicuspidata var. bicuspidata NRRL YB-4993]